MRTAAEPPPCPAQPPQAEAAHAADAARSASSASAHGAPGKIEALLAEVAAAPSVARAAERTDELVRALVEFYGDGLEKLLTIVYDAAGERSAQIFDALCEDRQVESLLALHNLHPLSLEDRVLAALESVRPYLATHDGDVEFVGIEGDAAVVRFLGTCDGCPSSSATMHHAVERAIRERIPEIAAVRADESSAGDATGPAFDPLLPRVLGGHDDARATGGGNTLGRSHEHV